MGDLQSQVNSLTSEKTSLENQVTTLSSSNVKVHYKSEKIFVPSELYSQGYVSGTQDNNSLATVVKPFKCRAIIMQPSSGGVNNAYMYFGTSNSVSILCQTTSTVDLTEKSYAVGDKIGFVANASYGASVSAFVVYQILNIV